MIFIIEFKLSIKYLNFDDYPEPVKDGVRPADSATPSKYSRTSVSNSSNNGTEEHDSGVLAIPTVEPGHKDVDTSISFLAVLARAAGAFIIIVSLAIFLNVYIRK